jgi:hypothetical protein
VGLGELMINVINDEGGISTMQWATYQEIMRERYEDGKRETWSIAIGALNSEIDKSVDEIELIGLQKAKIIIKEAIRANSAESLG